MIDNLPRAFAVGSERVVAWADLLDRINVFPVPDGDTGRNLVISLTPLRKVDAAPQDLIRELLMAARGNSGNIASRFLSAVIACEDVFQLPSICRNGRDLAYQAVSNPQPGTILTLFDALVESLSKHPPILERGEWLDNLLAHLKRTVEATKDTLPVLKEAGVVDAGALGMFVFFDSFFSELAGEQPQYSNLAEVFPDGMTVRDITSESPESTYCLDVVLKPFTDQSVLRQVLSEGVSIVAFEQKDRIKLHLHADDADKIRDRLADAGEILAWEQDDLAAQIRRFTHRAAKTAIHIMTDAAGSMTREDAVALGVTLLDSYITIGDVCLPETYWDPSRLFGAMKKGGKVSTSQASAYERYEHYKKVLSLYDKVLYLCVGSFYTGNYQVVMDWKAKNDPENRLLVLDTGAASGRLGLPALLTARRAAQTQDIEEVLAFASLVAAECREYIFLDKLHWLAAGGRMSKTGAFLGDMIGIKPVVTPTSKGAAKAGMVRSRKDQLAFALKKLEEEPPATEGAVIMLEYTDNKNWVEEVVLPELNNRYTQAEIIFQPVSLTSGAHMGPGTWGLAFFSGKKR